MLFTAVTLASTLSACVTASRGGDPLAWAPPGSVGQVASLESLVDSGNASGRSVARPAPVQVQRRARPVEGCPGLGLARDRSA
jgi:hypothetical protein